MPGGLYLWADSQACVHALSPVRHVRLGMTTMPDSPPQNEQTRHIGVDAAGFLARPLWDLLAAGVEAEGGITLMLDQSLPAAWHTLAWEHLNWRGEKLGALLRVIRYAKPTTESPKPAGDTLIWDMWPSDEFKAVYERHGIERRFRLEQIGQDVHRDAGHFARLVIIAHGGEGDAALLLDRDGEPWDIALPATLPYEVLLLACATYHGSFHALAVDCLDCGARTVVCGHGLLNARLMAQALTVWLDRNEPTHETLWALQAAQEPPEVGGVHWLRSEVGGVHWLRYYGAAPMTDYDLLTLNFFQCPNKPNPVTELSKSVNEDHEADIRIFLQTAHSAAGCCWPLTQSWLLPLALYWAEKFDHALLAPLKKQFDALLVFCDELMPERAYGMAAMYRRRGDYPKAVAQLAEGLGGDLTPQQEVNLLGSLLNDLIDLNLPAAGRQVVDRLDDSLATIDSDRQAFKLLDRRARLALRQGDCEAALCHWRTKRHASEDDSRELANLLYASAWFAHAETDRLAEQARCQLSSAADFGAGNDNAAYLLRALAAWQWRRRPGEDVLSAFLPVCAERMARQDPGPYAYTLIFHALAGGNTEHWQQAVAGLEQGRYWLELTAFQALAGNLPEAGRMLDRFHSQRDNALRHLDGHQLYGMDWLTEGAGRKALERDILLNHSVTADTLASNGLLPL